MYNFKLAIIAAAAVVAPQAASAADISFVGGVYNVSAPVRTAPGIYADIYSFSVAGLSSFSGSLTTQRLRNPAPTGPIVSDLDFTNVVLTGPSGFSQTFGVPTGGTDVVETVNLASTALLAGNYTLTVNYRVDTASTTSGASYGGTLNLASGAVPEPATWGTMLAGFGIVGFGMRRRRSARSVMA